MKHKSEPQSITRIIRKRRSDLLVARGYAELLFRVILIALIAVILFTQVFMFTRVKGNSMFPAVKDGDLLIGYRLQKELLVDDVVVCRIDGKHVPGRIVARYGDVVGLDESGQLYINGTPQSGEIMYPSYAKEGIEYPYKVPEGHFFIMGDYRTQAEDSRDFGPVPEEDVEAKVISILRRRGI